MSDLDSGSLEDQLAWVIRMPGFIKSLTKNGGAYEGFNLLYFMAFQ
jgi:hypothetical protein